MASLPPHRLGRRIPRAAAAEFYPGRRLLPARRCRQKLVAAVVMDRLRDLFIESGRLPATRERPNTSVQQQSGQYFSESEMSGAAGVG